MTVLKAFVMGRQHQQFHFLLLWQRTDAHRFRQGPTLHAWSGLQNIAVNISETIRMLLAENSHEHVIRPLVVKLREARFWPVTDSYRGHDVGK